MSVNIGGYAGEKLLHFFVFLCGKTIKKNAKKGLLSSLTVGNSFAGGTAERKMHRFMVGRGVGFGQKSPLL